MSERYIADPILGLVPADEFYTRKYAGVARSGFPCPRISTDTMEPVVNMLDGKQYDSKSALRATYKAAGVTEVGNDTSALKKNPPAKPDRREIKATIAKAFSKAGLGA